MLTMFRWATSALICLVVCACDNIDSSALAEDSVSADAAKSSTASVTALPIQAACSIPNSSSPTLTHAIDQDGDGVVLGLDCNDYNDAVYPGAYELCDYQDNDCNGETDENWHQIFANTFGTPCVAIGNNNCVSEGIWSCDMSLDWVACNAAPREPTLEKCNGIDDDCNGETDTDAWPELGTECVYTGDYCPLHGHWACDPYFEVPYCTGEDRVDDYLPTDCSPTSK